MSTVLWFYHGSIHVNQGRPYARIRGTQICTFQSGAFSYIGVQTEFVPLFLWWWTQAGGHENTLSWRQGDTVVYLCTQYGRPCVSTTWLTDSDQIENLSDLILNKIEQIETLKRPPYGRGLMFQTSRDLLLKQHLKVILHMRLLNIEEKRLHYQHALIFRGRLLSRCAYFWVYIVWEKVTGILARGNMQACKSKWKNLKSWTWDSSVVHRWRGH